jgi:hypothetical protein
MRLLVVAILAAGCAAEASKPAPATTPITEPALEVTFVDTIDGARATHLAVGGNLRVRVPGAFALSATAHGPFAIAQRDDVLVIRATGAGSGEIEIETSAGHARFAVSAAPIAHVGIVRDADASQRATIVLRDASGKRLVDASLRVAPGSAPVTFQRDAWDRVELAGLVDGVRVKTDLLAATAVQLRAMPISFAWCASHPGA